MNPAKWYDSVVLFSYTLCSDDVGLWCAYTYVCQSLGRKLFSTVLYVWKVFFSFKQFDFAIYSLYIYIYKAQRELYFDQLSDENNIMLALSLLNNII